MNSKQFKTLFLHSVSRLIMALIFHFAVNTPSYAGPFDDTTLITEKGNFEAVLDHLLPIAKEGNAEACYLVGKIYSIKVENSRDDMPKAIFWLAYARRLGNQNANQILSGYIREGYRTYVRLTEMKINDDAGYRKRSKIPGTFPDKARNESEEYWKSIFGKKPVSDLKLARYERTAAMSDLAVCRQAMNIRLNDWEEDIYAAEEVEEAALRNLTIEHCKTILSDAVPPN